MEYNFLWAHQTEKFKNHINDLINSSKYFSSNIEQLVEFNIVAKIFFFL